MFKSEKNKILENTNNIKNNHSKKLSSIFTNRPYFEKSNNFKNIQEAVSSSSPLKMLRSTSYSNVMNLQKDYEKATTINLKSTSREVSNSSNSLRLSNNKLSSYNYPIKMNQVGLPAIK
jgi:hypothetical protein